METMLIEVVNIVPELALAIVIVYFVLRRDDMWRSCFKEVAAQSDAASERIAAKSDAVTVRVASEYKELAERLEKVLVANTEAMSRMFSVTEMRQGLTESLANEIRKALADSTK